jgi:GrpB-like predicted nucleotidyltransferase (UPF0157 family)
VICRTARRERRDDSYRPSVRQDAIVIVEYDSGWPASFERERIALESVLHPVLVGTVEHIGSTAVPGLAAKAIIDMLAVVSDIEAASDHCALLGSVGWVAAPEPTDIEERRRSFCTPSVALRTHHLHVVEERSAGWRGWLAFRDHLRAHPLDRATYAELKRSLAEDVSDPNDRAGYRAGKAAFIQERTRLALAE